MYIYISVCVYVYSAIEYIVQLKKINYPCMKVICKVYNYLDQPYYFGTNQHTIYNINYSI